MNLQRKTISFKSIPFKFYAYAIFLIVHIALFNINVAEWGDSYRILRASEFIRQGSYPKDEKRPPLFSIFTATRVDEIDAVFWGRVVMLVFSFLSFYVFDKFSNLYIKEEKQHFVSLILFTFNPVYLYWSIRIMADVPFAFLVLLFFYLVKKWDRLSFIKIVLLGLLCGLAILTRFEGYLLLFSGLIAVIFHRHEVSFKKIKIKKIFNLFWINFPRVFILGLTTLFVISPWLLYRNPLKSSYFEETSGRIYDLNMVWIYFVSILYSFGFTSAFYFIFIKYKTVVSFLRKNVDITAFMILELFLILLWPAAIPRLFVCLLPFFIIILTLCIESLFENQNSLKKKKVSTILFPLITLLFYLVSQYFLKLQFLITNKKVFAVLVFLQILSIISYYLRRHYITIVFIVISAVVWSFSIIISHKDIYTAIKSAGVYSRDNLSGKIIYNDTTSVADWYINFSVPKSDLIGEKRNFFNKDDLSYNDLLTEDVSYVINTNEGGVGSDRGVEELAYLKLIKSFRYNVGSKEFFANIFRIERQK